MTRAINGSTRVAGVTGWPVSHSLSPRLHNAWLAASGLDGVYVAFPASPDRFAGFIHGLRGGVITGLNVTAPHKEAALALADVRSERADWAGAANLLLFGEDGAIMADNTDGEGLMAAFLAQAPGFDFEAGPILILGSGGAARGAAAALLQIGARKIVILARHLSSGEALADALGSRVAALKPEDMRSVASRLSAVINATPSGLEAARTLSLDLRDLAPSAIIMDMVYRPLITPLLQAAHDRGLRTVDGLEMLIGQARPSFTAFFGAPPPDLDLRALALAS
jgi:shikimate dehydrogenase